MQVLLFQKLGDTIFMVRQIQKKYIRKGGNLFLALADLEKALIGFMEWFPGGPYKKLDCMHGLCV